ncbi:hypothetical protein GCM10009651_30610 [Microbacterium natoriense]|uniref:hypothetical protein n=1 Tax=Microbacterium natoriense TaxID=284570 RepID=UPI0031D36CED
MSTAGGRAAQKAKGRPDRGGKGTGPGPGLLKSWIVVALVLVGIWAAFFGIPSVVRMLNAPPISEDFGLEDAVVALRLHADDHAYLVLVNEAGETRSVELEERGFEESRIAWSEAGLSVGGPADEYLIHDDGLTALPLSGAKESSSERARLAVADGFAVYTGSAEGQQLAFVDAATEEITTIDLGYVNPVLTTCGDDVALVDESGVRIVTPDSRDVDGLGVFTGVRTLVCDQDRALGLGEIVDEETSAHQSLQIWDRATGDRQELEIHYPESVLGWESGTPFVWEGRLHWAAGATLWSIPLAEIAESTSVDAEPAADLGGFVGDLSPVVRTDQGALAQSGGRVFGVATEEDFINPNRGESYDKLLSLAIFGADAISGERRIEIDVDGIDFPRRDLHVTAIAVNPEWAAGR